MPLQTGYKMKVIEKIRNQLLRNSRPVERQGTPDSRINNNNHRSTRNNYKMIASAQIMSSGDGFRKQNNLLQSLIGYFTSQINERSEDRYHRDPYVKEVEEAWKDFEEKAIY
jgi:hypothetical protein